VRDLVFERTELSRGQLDGLRERDAAITWVTWAGPRGSNEEVVEFAW